ncbi:MAG: class II fumarate hydratase [Phycisphaeraceae bacterium]|nr:class II fumarate hydratase [Phycisphaeraceae bacterium]
MTQTTRIERDSMGEMRVPVDALWGASTQRAVENFPVSGRAIPQEVIHALGLLKAACAGVNLELGKLSRELAEPIIAAAMEVAEGRHDGHFPVDVYQTGSGTSSNMNANEVIANLVNRKNVPGVKIHPNDHVNMGQSSNDTFPTAMHVAAARMIKDGLIPALRRVQETLAKHAKDWDGIVKVGRTHLMDATPIRMGQVFSGYARQMELAVMRAEAAYCSMRFNVPIGGTAVGTGINTHAEFGRRVCAELSRLTGVEFVEAENHFEAQATKDGFVSASGQLKTIAVSLSKIAGDIRLLGSGPRCGLGELQLPEIQPGSSIMPGKVNPVICESVIQVAARVIGNDATITVSDLGGVGSLFELNVAMPVIAQALLESIQLLTSVSHVLVDKLLVGLRVNEARCRELMEQSLMMVTSLAPVLGYDQAAKLAKRAMAEGKTIRQTVLEEKLLEASKLDALLDPRSMTEPGGSGAAGGS